MFLWGLLNIGSTTTIPRWDKLNLQLASSWILNAKTNEIVNYLHCYSIRVLIFHNLNLCRSHNVKSPLKHFPLKSRQCRQTVQNRAGRYFRNRQIYPYICYSWRPRMGTRQYIHSFIHDWIGKWLSGQITVRRHAAKIGTINFNQIKMIFL